MHKNNPNAASDDVGKRQTLGDLVPSITAALKAPVMAMPEGNSIILQTSSVSASMVKDPVINKNKSMLQYVKEFETSGLTQAAFCKQNNINYSTFCRWKNKHIPMLINTELINKTGNNIRQIVLDTETTGLSTENGDRIIEIGCVEIIDRMITGKVFHSYCNPERKVGIEAISVHGINDDFLLNKTKFGEIVDNFLDFIKDAELIIHNAAFDIKFINYELYLLQHGIQDISKYFKITDTLKIARAMFPGQTNSLDALIKRYRIDVDRTFHGALLDANILARLVLEMTSEFILNYSTLAAITNTKTNTAIKDKFNNTHAEIATEIISPKDTINPPKKITLFASNMLTASANHKRLFSALESNTTKSIIFSSNSSYPKGQTQPFSTTVQGDIKEPLESPDQKEKMMLTSYKQKLYIPPYKRRILEEQKIGDQAAIILDQIPSKVDDCYWIYAKNPRYNREDSDKIGKWLIFVAKATIDTSWQTIKNATTAGELGISAKCSTNKLNPIAEQCKNKDSNVICVYTYDYDDLADVKRVRNKLFELGFIQPLGYKTDEATKAGHYSFNRSGSVCRYRM